MLFVACLLCCISITHAQTMRYWVGPANGLWNATANWSATNGGSGGETVPNGSTYTAVFSQPAEVSVNVTSISLYGLKVINSANVKLYASANTTITISGNSPAPDQAFLVEAGSTLIDSTTADVRFIINFGNSATGSIAGAWRFTGNPAVSYSNINGATFSMPSITGQLTTVDVTGTMIFNEKALTPGTQSASTPYLTFHAGSVFLNDRNGGMTPNATWDAASTIRITGAVSALPTISVGPEPRSIGHLVVDCPALSVPQPTDPLRWSLPNDLIIQGDLQFINTNNKFVTIGSTYQERPIQLTVNGDLDISSSSKVYLGKNADADDDASFTLEVKGDLHLAGTFDLHENNPVPTVQPSVMKLGGDFVQTGGYFGTNSSATSNSQELFVLEMNGTVAQTISSSTETIDNTQNMITLRLNNPDGVTLLSPLSVGKISWNSDGKGNLATSSVNVLTVNNTNESDPTVINQPSDEGYISGPVTRHTEGAGVYSFPVGKGTSILRYVDIVPATAAPSSYTVEYFNTSYTSTSPATPLRAVTNQEYWMISKSIGSSNAQVILHLNGTTAIPGASGTDKIVVARFNTGGSNRWENMKGVNGTEISPGNSVSGSATSDVLTDFSPFTFGILPGAPLPVYLVDFNARKGSGNTALLNWTVTANSDPDRFEVLRSTDGGQFNNVGTVNASIGQLDFAFTDPALPVGTTYYRLRMIDRNNVPTLSKIVAVINGADGFLITSMQPTIVSDQARLSISSSKKATVRLVITDMYGRVLRQQASGIAVGNQDIWLNNLSSLSAGAYQVTGYLDDGGRTSTIRFIKR